MLLRDNDDDKQCLPVARTRHLKIDLHRRAVCKTPLSQGFELWGNNWRYWTTPPPSRWPCGAGAWELRETQNRTILFWKLLSSIFLQEFNLCNVNKIRFAVRTCGRKRNKQLVKVSVIAKLGKKGETRTKSFKIWWSRCAAAANSQTSLFCCALCTP